MKIREIYIHNFRSFRGPNRISFLNPVTERVHSVSVIAGPNGSGKSTLLEAVAAILSYIPTISNMPSQFIDNEQLAVYSEFMNELLSTGLICLSIEISADDYSDAELVEYENSLPLNQTAQKSSLPSIIHLAFGRQELLPNDHETLWPNLGFHLRTNAPTLGERSNIQKSEQATVLSASIHNQLSQSSKMLTGGLILFPHNRQLSTPKHGAIEPPTELKSWISRFQNSDSWAGSLQQFWVWQNYLDLEQGDSNHSQLGSFVDVVESIFGEDRKIRIEQGEVTLPVSWANGDGEEYRISLDQLPSGEQQVLLLFGELARRRRPGGIIAIDEVENSLHPTMQRLVMANLRKIARDWDSQVIVSTHSLDVLNSVRGSGAILLGDIHQAPEKNGYYTSDLEESQP